ncbi:uncharacterized protein LOC122093071 [Macadamia integrifolia]|uniref:uncharacterized protein LOC122093071 n=1 Tax=Macadamia integrifolia TaxID=60698 RepID=UPI001C527FD6|nr:uncharacterized protein LOC122093071 [Macadamia integrifolia]
MGNCLRHDQCSDSEMTWGGDYWGSPGSPQLEKLIFTKDTRNGEKKREEEEKKAHLDEMLCGSGEKKNRVGGVASATATVTEVKLTITRKQLEELVGKADAQGMSVQQMLTHLMNVDDRHHHQAHHRSWRPALQSIPE